MKSLLLLLWLCLPALTAELSLDDKSAIRIEVEGIRLDAANLRNEVQRAKGANDELRIVRDALDAKATAAMVAQAVVASQSEGLQVKINGLTTANITLEAELKSSRHANTVLICWLVGVIVLVVAFFIARQYVPFLKAI